VFVVDEAEEIPSYETFKKVYYSIRSVDKRNLSILILNPTTKEHWIYKELFEKQSIQDGFCGVKDNILYIHSSYLDVNPKFIPENLRNDYQKLKLDDIDEYNNVVLGGWITDPKGSLFKRNELHYFNGPLAKENVVSKLGFVDVADSGTDDHAVPIGYLIGDKIFIEDVLYTKEGTEVNVPRTAELINKHVPEYVRVETNFGGSMYISLLQPQLNAITALMPIRATTNKHSRIVTMSGFIKNHVLFRNDYEPGTEYDNFMKCIFGYLADGKAEHDDAPDALEGLCALARQFYPHLWE
jgi:predicted phage terminase large subunit-like protein